MLLFRNLSPPQSKDKISSLYLLLLPRSVVIINSILITLISSNLLSYLSTKEEDTFFILPFVLNQFLALASSIFRANVFGQWVVTHSLDDSDFHGHVLAVTTHQHLLWNLKWAKINLTFYQNVRFIPHRLSCLPW